MDLTRARLFTGFTIVAMCLLALPSLVQHGMFMDGVQYACVARNLASGEGSFWFPFLSPSWSKMGENAFLEHPPLSYFLQSLVFRITGDTVFAEKAYCLLMAVFCAMLIRKIWITILKNERTLSGHWWLPVLLWFTIPSVFWSFSNNMIENTVSVFVLASSYCLLRSCEPGSNTRYIILTGIFIFLGSMCKGLPAIFPLAFLPLRYLLLRDVPLKKIIFYTVIVLLIPAAIYFLILAFDAGAMNSLQFYVEKRLLNRLENDPTVENRFTILFWLLTDLLVPVALFFILGLIFKFRSFAEGAKNRYRPALFFLLYGLCGVAPLAITHVQRATYFVPALPFIALGSALLIIDRISEIIDSMNLRAVKTVRAVVVCLFVFCAILCVALAGKTGRDGKLLSDTHKIGAVTGKGISIGTSFEIYSKWDLQFYLLRYYNCALFVTRDSTERYLLLNSPADPFLKGYSAPVNLTGYTLFSKKNK